MLQNTKDNTIKKSMRKKNNKYKNRRERDALLISTKLKIKYILIIEYIGVLLLTILY